MTRARECGSKEPLSRVEAESHAWQRRRQMSVRLQAYQCRFCGSWHVGRVRTWKRGTR